MVIVFITILNRFYDWLHLPSSVHICMSINVSHVYRQRKTLSFFMIINGPYFILPVATVKLRVVNNEYHISIRSSLVGSRFTFLYQDLCIVYAFWQVFFMLAMKHYTCL